MSKHEWAFANLKESEESRLVDFLKEGWRIGARTYIKKGTTVGNVVTDESSIHVSLFRPWKNRITEADGVFNGVHIVSVDLS